MAKTKQKASNYETFFHGLSFNDKKLEIKTQNK